MVERLQNCRYNTHHWQSIIV